jgi:hypothetical protein
LLVARLQADLSFPSEAARVQAFIAAGAGCRATYYSSCRTFRSASTTTPQCGPHHGQPGEDGEAELKAYPAVRTHDMPTRNYPNTIGSNTPSTSANTSSAGAAVLIGRRSRASIC